MRTSKDVVVFDPNGQGWVVSESQSQPFSPIVRRVDKENIAPPPLQHSQTPRLPRKPAAPAAPAAPSAPSVRALERRIAELEQDNAQLRALLKVITGLCKLKLQR